MLGENQFRSVEASPASMSPMELWLKGGGILDYPDMVNVEMVAPFGNSHGNSSSVGVYSTAGGDKN